MLLALMLSFSTFSQSLVCEQGLQELKSDLLARTNQRFDQNGEPAAIIKVHSTLTGLKFESSYIVGEVAYEAGQYIIYIAQGAKNIEVFKTGYIPCKVVFADKSDIKSVIKQTTYSLIIGETRQMGGLNVTTIPTGAEVYIDDEYRGTTPLNAQVQIGKHHVSIVKEHYASKELTVDIREGKETVVHEKLSNSTAKLRIVTDDVSDIYIDDVQVGTGDITEELALGTHYVKVSYQNGALSRSQTETIRLQGDKLVTIYLLGSLQLDESKESLSNVNVVLYPQSQKRSFGYIYVSGNKTDNLYGKYKVSVSKDGYWERKKTITIHEGENVTYTIPKLHRNTRLIFFNYQFSPRGVIGGMLGWCNKIGPYVSGRANINFASLQKSNQTNTSSPTDVTYPFGIQGWCINVGPMIRCAPWLYINLGIGYGTYNSDGKSFASVDTKGLNAELGLNFVINGFTMSVGYSTICNKTITTISPLSNICAGIGFAL